MEIITRINHDILQLVIQLLDTHSLAALSQTCSFFHSMVRRELAFDSITSIPRPFLHAPLPLQGRGLREPNGQGPPVYLLRSMARVADKLFMPFTSAHPVCFVYDISSDIWHPPYRLQVPTEYTPFVTPVVSIKSRIYMFGGRRTPSGSFSNDLYCLDTVTWVLEKITAQGGPIPRPRFDHTLDVLQDRYLVVFGGICPDSVGENDLFLFDTATRMWIEPSTQGQVPPARFGHASIIINNALYIFGGCQIQPEGNKVHDILYCLDCVTWTWYKFDHPEAYSYRRQYDPAITRELIASLKRDCIEETTGHPPQDRFHCAMVTVGPKLIILGGHTIRQDHEDNNVLHMISLRNVDVFHIRRRHWSTTCVDSEVYPQNISCFMMNAQNGYRILIVGQQRIFAEPSFSTDDNQSQWSHPVSDDGGYLDTTIPNMSTPTRSLPYQWGSGDSQQSDESMDVQSIVSSVPYDTIHGLVEDDYNHDSNDTDTILQDSIEPLCILIAFD